LEMRLKIRGKPVNESEFSASLTRERKIALARARAQVRGVFESQAVRSETVAQVTKAKLVANYLGDYRI